ncbi:MAG: hypothetical protein OT643_12695, partial [Bacteroidetes bacterium]|nr:hypothetical protein [Bacteroidota bacterium]
MKKNLFKGNIFVFVCTLMASIYGQAQTKIFSLFSENFEKPKYFQFQLNSDTIPAKGDNKWIVNKTYNGSGVYPNTTD